MTLPTTQTPEAWRKEYAASPALQGEFVAADHYVAFRQAEARGLVRTLQGGGYHAHTAGNGARRS